MFFDHLAEYVAFISSFNSYNSSVKQVLFYVHDGGPEK